MAAIHESDSALDSREERLRPVGITLGDSTAARAACIVVLAVSDALALIGALAIAYLLWALPIKHQSALLYLELVPLVPLFLLGYAQSGLYPGFGLGPVETLRRQSYVTTFGFVILATFSFALKLPHL